MKRPIPQEISTDVLVIGGGLAGLNAAIAAAEKGAQVLVMDKGGIARSGSVGGGVDHFFAYLNEGEPWDTREGYLEYCANVARGAVDLDIVDAIYCDELEAALERMERIGASLRLDGKTYLRSSSFGAKGSYWVNFNGKRLKPALAKESRRLKVKVLEKTMATRLFAYDGAACGAAGFNIRTGELYAIKAKAIVGATGNTVRLFKTPTNMPFNTWHCPYNTGDIFSMACDIGAELANMEYVRMSLMPKGFSAAGFNAIFSMGCKLVNGQGEYFMERYSKTANKSARNIMVSSCISELQAGRGPLYVDGRHLKAADRKHLMTLLGYDKDTLPDFLEAKGQADFGSALVEIMVSEGSQAGPSEVVGAGILIDKNCASTVPGLFAAGDSSHMQRCVHLCTTGGYHAGKAAAGYAAKVNTLPELNARDLKEEWKKTYAPLERKNGIRYNEFEDVVRSIMTDHLVPSKSETSLKTAMAKLTRFDPFKEQLRADNTHELMRVHEAQHIIEVGKIMCQASLARKESRFPPYHYRTDFPEQNDEEFCGLIVVRKGRNSGIETRFQKLEYLL
jgi:adenylylsulfate reductase subunit A